ncbi:alpha/beta hydrolase [Aliiroseovarius sp. S1339]|uniref:alpha/beta hydrolase n=1 Tax=Aliiroseovarius sp. S1339 TaxID=2936990 RepID=UPI0020C073D2|nr:alpha/beta hydrolase family protein [Aliiroseovarius sp. S1339]MCK8463744.1 alpha/beta hydrolase [Aliiroseovarius sp. S1339]
MATTLRTISERMIGYRFQRAKLPALVRPLFASAFLLLVAHAALADRTFVLVHGAFVGGWYWDPVANGLRQKGHRVFAVDLTGHGTKADENGPDVTIDQHIRDVVEAIEDSGEPVILVSHSYGGRPATGAWDVARDQIAAVIFVEAVAPYGSGQFALPDERSQRAELVKNNPVAIETGLLQPGPQLQLRYPKHTIVPQSIRALYSAVPLALGPLPDTPGAYVVGSHCQAPIFRQYARKVAQERTWTIWEIESGHDVVGDASEILTRLLDKLAQELPTAK